MIKRFWQEYYEIIIISLVAAFLFIWKIYSTPILDGDTAFYAEIAKNIVKSGNWMTMRFIDPTDIINKPPLVMWLMAFSYKLFGINELAISLWHSLMAVIIIIFTYTLARELFSRRCAFISSLILLTSGLFFYQARSPLQDIPLTLFILGSFLFFMLFDRKRNAFHLYISAICISLAVLTKGPIGLVIPGLIIFLHVIINRRIKNYSKIDWLIHLPVATVIFFATCLPWFMQQYNIWGTRFLDVFVLHNFGRFFHPTDVIGRGTAAAPQYDFYSYPLQLLILMIPWSAFVYPSMWFFFRKRNHKFKSLLIYALVILGIFSFSLNYKISRYILPAIPILAIMVAKLLNDHLHDPSLKSYINWSALINFVLVIPPMILITTYFALNFPETQAAYQPILIPPIAILTIGLLISNIFLLTPYKKLAIASFFLTGLIAFGVLVPLTGSYFSKANPTKTFCLKIRSLASPDDRIFKYTGAPDTLMTFYCDRPVKTINSKELMIKELKNRKTKVFAMTEDNASLKDIDFPIKLLTKENNYILFTN